VEARIGSRAKAQQIGGNLNTLIMLRVKNSDTAKILTDQLDEVELVTTLSASQASDSNNPLDFSDFTSRNEDRLSTRTAPMIGRRPGAPAQGPGLRPDRGRASSTSCACRCRMPPTTR